MKLNINKACDLNSIPVLPPHSRRSSAMSQASQIRSQSQSQFSQVMSSQSQLSQSSFEENLMTDQRFGSQERDDSLKRRSSLPSVLPPRDESQLQLARTSNTVTRRWGSASAPDNRYQVSEDLDNRFRQIEGSLNRLGMILDSVQNDVIQVNRTVKEVSIETEGVRQKIVLLDSSTGHVIKEDQLKAFLDANLKSISKQIMDSNDNKLDEIASSISVLPKQIESQLVKFQHEVCTFVAEKVIANGLKSFNGSYQDPTQSPKNKCCTATRESQKSSMYSIIETASRQPRKNQMPMYSPVLPPSSHTRRVPLPKKEAEIRKALKPKPTGSNHMVTLKKKEIPKALKPKLTGSNHMVTLKKEEILLAPKMKDFRVIIDSDEESDGGVSCLLVKKETGKATYLIEEAKEETLQILRKARKRKRKQDKCLILD